MQAQPNEILGSNDASHIIKFEYDHGNLRHVRAAMKKIDEVAAGQFQYTLYNDAGETGCRLEVTLFLNSKSDNG